jgi:hypothetical protein
LAKALFLTVIQSPRLKKSRHANILNSDVRLIATWPKGAK